MAIWIFSTIGMFALIKLASFGDLYKIYQIVKLKISQSFLLDIYNEGTLSHKSWNSQKNLDSSGFELSHANLKITLVNFFFV